MATVQVLCSNGRRQNVKITPNTKLLQVSRTLDYKLYPVLLFDTFKYVTLCSSTSIWSLSRKFFLYRHGMCFRASSVFVLSILF